MAASLRKTHSLASRIGKQNFAAILQNAGKSHFSPPLPHLSPFPMLSRFQLMKAGSQAADM